MTDKEETPLKDGPGGGAGDVLVNEECHQVNCPNIGPINVYLQGNRSGNSVAILTVHDLGCDHTMYFDFVMHDQMTSIRGRTLWVHVDVPGQSHDAPDLPADYVYPTMQQIAQDLIHVLDDLKIRQVVCFGEGAGANILSRFSSMYQERVLGVVLLHCTGTTAGFMESIKDKVINWKLDHSGMNPTAEAYLVLHRFGSFSSHENKETLKTTVENYQETLRNQVNPKNLKKFVEAFLKRTSVTDGMKKIKCPILFVTGSKSIFHRTTHQLHEHMMKVADDKGRVELLQVGGCANVLEERPEKFIESFQYFLQGLGLVSAVPMAHLKRMNQRMRSMSMEEYDIPKFARQRTLSGGDGNNLPDHPLRYS